MIIQGTNRPFVFKLKDSPTIDFLRVSMWDENDDLIKVWTKDDVNIDDDGYVICPITEAESFQFYPGMARIEIDLKDTEGRKYMIPPISEQILERKNKVAT